MRRTLIKGIALMLALLTLLSAVACATVGEGDETTTSGETTAGGDMSSAGETTEEVTETAELHPLTVPEDYKVDDKVSLLYWSDVEMPEFEVEDITGHTVNDQIYWRNEYTEERLGMTFEWHSTPGNSGNRTQFAAFVEASYEANDRAYDIVSAYSRTVRYYNAKFYDSDGTLMKAVRVAYGSQAVPPDTLKTGFAFVGWTPSNLTIYGDTNFYGTWKVDEGWLVRKNIPNDFGETKAIGRAIYSNDGSRVFITSGTALKMYDATVEPNRL